MSTQFSLSKVQDVLQTIQGAVAAGINASIAAGQNLGLGQVVVGWPVATELTNILAQNNEQWQITVHDRGVAKNDTRYRPEARQIIAYTPPLSNTIAGHVITFALVPPMVAGIDIWTFVGPYGTPCVYTAVLNDTAASVAVGVAAAVNALGLSGVAATPSGVTVSITNSPNLRCNVSGFQATMAFEIGRVERSVQISLWCPDPNVRFPLFDAVVLAVGTVSPRFFTLTDGTTVSVRYENDLQVDKSQSSYSLYEHHYVVSAQYGLNRPTLGYQVGVIPVTEQVNAHTPTVQNIGG